MSTWTAKRLTSKLALILGAAGALVLVGLGVWVGTKDRQPDDHGVEAAIAASRDGEPDFQELVQKCLDFEVKSHKFPFKIQDITRWSVPLAALLYSTKARYYYNGYGPEAGYNEVGGLGLSDHDVAVYAIRSRTAKSPWKVIMLINLTLKQLDELGPRPRLEVFSALQGFCDAAWADSSVDEDNRYCLSSIVTNEGAGKKGIFLWGLYDVQEKTMSFIDPEAVDLVFRPQYGVQKVCVQPEGIIQTCKSVKLREHAGQLLFITVIDDQILDILLSVNEQ